MTVKMMSVLCHLKEQDEHKVRTDKGVQKLFRNGLRKTQKKLNCTK